MFKKFRHIAILLISFVFVMSFTGVFAALKPSNDFYVNDFAGVLSEETRKYILDNSYELWKKTKAQVVVATVKSLEGKSISDYSMEVFRDWSLGDENLKNGLLVFLSVDDREVKIDVGHGLEGRINDSKAGRFLDEYSVPYFKNNDWDTGIKVLYSALLKEVYDEYEMEVPNEVSSVVRENSNVDYDISIIVIIVFALIVIYCMFFPAGRGSSGHYYGGDFDGGGGFSSGGFGGFSGGDSGGFSGGGGSCGGGGASRSF